MISIRTLSLRKTSSASLVIRLSSNPRDDLDVNWHCVRLHRRLAVIVPVSTRATISCPTWASSACQCHTQPQTFQCDRAWFRHQWESDENARIHSQRGSVEDEVSFYFFVCFVFAPTDLSFIREIWNVFFDYNVSARADRCRRHAEEYIN